MGVGEIVLVKSFPSEPLLRSVFEEKDDFVMLCLEEESRLWEEERIKAQTVRCPKSRVYNYDPELYSRLKEAAYVLEDENLLETLWGQAQRYYGHDKETQQVGK